MLTALNSSTDVVLERVRACKGAFLTRSAALFPADPVELAHYLTADPRGRQVPGYLVLLGRILEDERTATIADVELVQRRLEHVKAVIARQQSFARASAMVERVSITKKLFGYGFTTKRDGHGFGLAGCLLDARALGGTARAHSGGPGTGATFSLRLPVSGGRPGCRKRR